MESYVTENRKTPRVILKERVITSDEYRDETMKKNQEKEEAERLKQMREEKGEVNKDRKRELAKKKGIIEETEFKVRQTTNKSSKTETTTFSFI